MTLSLASPFPWDTAPPTATALSAGSTQGGGNAWKGHKHHIFIAAWEDIE